MTAGFKHIQTVFATFLQNYGAPVWIGLCLLLGGASQGGMIANAILQLCAAGIIGLAIWQKWSDMQMLEERPLHVLWTCLIVWLLWMLVPLPPSLWTQLPGREFVARGYQLLGMEQPWLPIAMAPDRALRSILTLMIPLASYLLVRRTDSSGRKRIIIVVIASAISSACLGLAQIATGVASDLRLYSPTNLDSPVGLFANTNHFSVFLVVTLPRAAALAAQLMPETKKTRRLVWGLLALILFFTFVLALGRSLAGLGLLAMAITGCVFLLYSKASSIRMWYAMLAGAMLGLLVAAVALYSIGAGVIGAKFDDAPNSRQQMTPVTISTGDAMSPLGSGAGSFAQVYPMFQPDSLTSPTWVNHAHNDLVEVYLELGIPGLILIFGFLIWFMGRGWSLLNTLHRLENKLAQAAWLSAAMLLLHSMVDYPLRTSALASLFAVAIGLVCIPAISNSKQH